MIAHVRAYCASCNGAIRENAPGGGFGLPFDESASHDPEHLGVESHPLFAILRRVALALG